MIIHHIPITSPITITPEPFTREAFAPFGDAISNPRPDVHPSHVLPANANTNTSTATTTTADELPFGAVSANQGTAIQYRALASARESYGRAPSRAPASPRTTMFVCGARRATAAGAGFEVDVLERHPYTSQTFVPLGAGASARYLVVVAPTLPGSSDGGGGGGGVDGGMPDVGALRAFVATGAQAVTYAAGTWHAPMMALGPPGSALDFVVVQFANDVPVEDCQEVGLESRAEGARVLVRVPEGRGGAKL